MPAHSGMEEGLLISTLFYMLELKPEVSFVTIFETQHSHYKPMICKYHALRKLIPKTASRRASH